MSIYKGKSSPIYLFFFFFIIELVLCGSGQIIHIVGGLTLRMLNFLFALFIASLYLCRRCMNAETGRMLLLFILTICIGVSLCLISDNAENLFDDIKQQSFFLVLPFIFYMVRNMDIINSISKIIRYSTLLIAIIYLVYIVLIKYVGVIDFSVAYYLISEYSDFMFRGNEGELFYKGFVYLVIGLIFWIKEKKYLCSLLILLAIYYTMTRGFYVITFLCILGYYITLRRFTISTIIFVLFFCSISLLIVNGLGLFDMGENRADGDVIRIMTMQQVFERITPFSFVLGHGFGYGVPIRMVHMENSFLEIFHKQGVLGLFLWGYLLHKIIAFYKRTPSNYKGVSSVYMIGTIGVYVQSLFNPYLINPIGMSFVLLSFVVCNKLSKINESPVCSRSLSTKIA